MPVQTFRLRTDLQSIIRRDFAPADTTLLLPSNANPLEMGEFLSLDANYHVVRGTGATPAFAMFVEKGRSDTQAIGKVTCLFLGAYEAETLIYTAGTIAVGEPLKVDESVSYGGLNKAGLIEHPADSDMIVGYCTHIVAGGYLRFINTQA